MSTESKFFIGIGVITLVVIASGAVLFSKQSSSQGQTQGATQSVNQSDLIANAPHTVGSPTAPVIVVEFADLQCPACKAAQPIVKQVLEKYGQDVYFVWRHYPLSSHKNSKVAANASEAAAGQGKFFEFVDKVYTNQGEWENSGNADEIFEKYASEIGLGLEKFKADLNTGTQSIESDFALGNKFSVTSTPTFFINGQKYSGVVQLDQFEQIINATKGKTGEPSTLEQPGQLPAENQ